MAKQYSLDSGLKKAEIQLKADEKFKHLGYAVQWIFFGLLSIGLAVMIRRKNINVKNQTKKNLIFWLIVTVCAAPVVLATLTYYVLNPLNC